MQSDLASLLTGRKSRVPFSDSVQLQRLQELPKLGSLGPQRRSDEVQIAQQGTLEQRLLITLVEQRGQATTPTKCSVSVAAPQQSLVLAGFISIPAFQGTRPLALCVLQLAALVTASHRFKMGNSTLLQRFLFSLRPSIK